VGPNNLGRSLCVTIGETNPVYNLLKRTEESLPWSEYELVWPHHPTALHLPH
jgi:hypothetical protein